MNSARRNDPCPCGSGRKYKRCCLVARDAAAIDRRECEAMWARMQAWAFGRFGEELGSALAEHLSGRGVGTAERPANDDDLTLALSWLLIDRRLACGDTPARVYAGLPELSTRERWLASRIAASRLGVHRVIAAEPGAWIELEDVLTEARVRVDSPNVSIDAVRWDVLICRVERGGSEPVLWGGAAFYGPAEEPEILAELRRIADANGLGTGAAGLEAALTVGAREMAGFVPPSRLAEKTFYTPEGDPVTFAEATWRLRDPEAAVRALCGTSELALCDEDEDGYEDEYVFDWLARRRSLLARRPVLPPGALVLERGPVALDERGELHGSDVTSLGTFTVRGDVLELVCLSERRLDGAVALVERNLGSLATGLKRRLRSVEEVRSIGEARGTSAGGPAGARAEAASRRPRLGSSAALEADFRAFVYRRWIDDPNPRLGGLSPREAAGRPELREELEEQLRIVEHGNARDRDHPLRGPEVAWLRGELALGCEPVAR